jgi:NAD(P)-dependent dehydrogenase (short-subunit alcohol dehydrogenase family)
MSSRIALITGGSRGLGRSTAVHLAEQGIDVALTYHSRRDEAASVVGAVQANGARAAALRLDTTDTSSFPDFAEELARTLDQVWDRGTFDFLVNNAGFGHHASFAETTEEAFDALVDVHLKGVFFLTQRLLPLMEDGGRIVNVSTGLARFTLPGFSAYASMKGAVEVLTRYLAKELGPRGISVNTVAPGAVETDFGGGLVRDNAEVNRMIASATAMGRVGLPDDIGGGVAGLLAGDLQWMTGQRVDLSGGQSL